MAIMNHGKTDLDRPAITMVHGPFGAAQGRPGAEGDKAEDRDFENQSGIPSQETRYLLQELVAHQIELETQNEELRRTQQELEASRARYYDLYHQAPVGYCTLSREGLILEANLAAAVLLGTDAEALVNRPLTGFILPADQDIFYRLRKQIFASSSTGAGPPGSGSVGELRLVRLDGTPFWARLEAAGTRDGENGTMVCRIVMSDITDYKKMEEALADSLQKLKLFTYSLIHDLKSPTIGLGGLTRRLIKHCRNLLDEKGRDYCDQIIKISEHIGEFVEKINIFTATQESPLSIETINLNQIFDLLKKEFSSKLTERQVEWLEPEKEIEIRADRLSLLRILRNLIDNALKYGGNELTRIGIGYQESKDFYILSVSNDGPGIKEEDRGDIFLPFQRKAPSGDVSGAGLGLAIVKEIAEKHKGQVWVEPSSPKGITFFVSISKVI